MALDHVRDFVMTAAVQDPTADPASSPLNLPPGGSHFCAPTFVFLAGASAGLMTRRKRPTELASFLLTRGLWLLVLEVLVISIMVVRPDGHRPARRTNLRSPAGDLGDWCQHGGLGGRAIPGSAGVSRHRCGDLAGPQSVGRGLAGSDTPETPPPCGRYFMRDSYTRSARSRSSSPTRCCPGSASSSLVTAPLVFSSSRRNSGANGYCASGWVWSSRSFWSCSEYIR